LAKSLVGFFNVVNLFFFIPFGVLLLKDGYSTWGVVGWWLSIGSIILTTNFLNIMLNSKDQDVDACRH
jgi:hypothetical protein